MVRNPYGDEDLVAIPSLRPDWAVIHVPEADARGNARIYGSPFWDRLMARAARRVLITAERILPGAELARQPELTAIPEIMVRAVVHAPGGAWPGSCHPLYGVDYQGVEAYLDVARDSAGLVAHLAAAADADRSPEGRPTPGGLRTTDGPPTPGGSPTLDGHPPPDPALVTSGDPAAELARPGRPSHPPPATW